MAFLQGPEMNLTRLCELIVFVLNHTTCSADALYFDRYASWCPHPRSSCSAFFLLGHMLRGELRNLGVDFVEKWLWKK
jgi:Kip1 ubiquitination-promoting complex protein 1